MNQIEFLQSIENKLLNGELVIDMSIYNSIANISKEVMCKTVVDHIDMEIMRLIISISNILYNNTTINILPIDDDMYDSMVWKYKDNGGIYQIGAIPIDFKEVEYKSESINSDTLIKPFTILNREELIEDSLFINKDNLLNNPNLNNKDFMVTPFIIKKNVEKKNLSTRHMYPKLVGTLDKCKITLNTEAVDKGVYNDSKIKIFERDFLGKHLQMGLFDINTPITLICELKYDGLAVEAEVSDHIISARSRGDTANDIGADLTPILQGYPFRQAIGKVDPNETFGMQFEAIITKYNLDILSNEKNKDYKNARNAIIGLFGSLDGYMYRDLITLIPLATSIEDISRIEEIEFMNKYYHSGELLRYSVIQGTYVDVLYQVSKFVNEAEYMRPYIPFMYDGVVVSYADKNIIDKLGITNSVKNYSVAIKFNPLKKETIFLGYEYTVGQTGTITPMIKYKPIEFFGTIHDEATGHSYARFNNLQLRVGDILEVEYRHDVMAYVSKPDNDHNKNNTNPIIEFPTNCPACNSPIYISDSGKRASCNNINCNGRKLARLTTMVDRLNIKDFSLESIRAVGIQSFVDLMNLTPEQTEILGKENSKKFLSRIETFKNSTITDYNIMSALCFTDIAAGTWKLALSVIRIQDLLIYTDDELRQLLYPIKGLGSATIETICRERKLFENDINWIIENMYNNIIKTSETSAKEIIRFSGIRNNDLVSKLSAFGYDIAEGSVTKSTNILIVPSYEYTSDKVTKAKSLPSCKIVTLNDFVSDMSKYLL